MAERARRVDGKTDTEERSQSRHGVGEEALNRISVGVTVTDVVVKVIFRNPLGAELVLYQDRLLVDYGQTLLAARFEDTAALHALLCDLAEGNFYGYGQAISIQRPSMVRLYSVRAEGRWGF